ncbi:hypothetical protein BOX15_Mlig002265g1 [Macrostomum lignano]|uniref:Uncharacterized protein n=1 Tax=Macrostomum lignano TaxID=282301 RepID=A0A267DY14_9PLAT|nr:hypothetical protein BOX15_Mlig002265g1 [Macrostomum lignano]
MAAKKRWLSMVGEEDLVSDAVTAAPQPQPPAEPDGAMPPKKRLMMQLKHKESQKKRVSLSEYYQKKTSNNSNSINNAAESSATTASEDPDPDLDPAVEVDDPGNVSMDLETNSGYGPDETDRNSFAGAYYDSAMLLPSTPPNNLESETAGFDEDRGGLAGDEVLQSSRAPTAAADCLPQFDELGEATDAREFVLQQQQQKQHRKSESKGQHEDKVRRHRGAQEHKSSEHKHRKRHRHHDRNAHKDSSSSHRRHRHERHGNHHGHHRRHRQESGGVGGAGAGSNSDSRRAAHSFDAFVERQMSRMRQRQAAKEAAAAADRLSSAGSNSKTGEVLRRQLELREGEKVQRAESFLYADEQGAVEQHIAQPIVPVSSSFIDRVVASSSSGGDGVGGRTSTTVTQSTGQQRQVAVVKPQVSSLLGGIVRLVANSLGDVQRNLQRQMMQQQSLQQLQQQQKQQQQQNQAKAAAESSAAADDGSFLGVAGYGAPATNPPPSSTTTNSKTRRS